MRRLTEEMKKKLIDMGLNKYQAESKTAEVIVELLMPDEGRKLMEAAEEYASDMCERAKVIKQDIEDSSDMLKAIIEAEDKYGKVTDERAVQAVALYGALIEMANNIEGADASQAVRNAGYIVYAYLGGQARKEAEWDKDE